MVPESVLHRFNSAWLRSGSPAPIGSASEASRHLMFAACRACRRIGVLLILALPAMMNNEGLLHGSGTHEKGELA
jgi:hypothetical protein